MPEPDAPPLLLATTGTTLVLVGRRPPDAGTPAPHRPRPDRRLTRYTRLFDAAGSAAFFSAGVLARLPMGMFAVSAVVMVAAARDSYALAGAVSATSLLGTAVIAPLVARATDRHGQARVAVPAASAAVAAHVTLAASVRAEAPSWTLFLCAALTSTAPNVGAMSRARWTHLYRADPQARHTANSLEQAADELCFMLGPVLAVTLAVSFFPEAGTLCAAALLLFGTLVFAFQRRTEPPLADRDRSSRPPARTRGVPPLLATFLCTGVIFGSLEVITVAFADANGHPGLAGPVLGLQAAGSGLAGLAFGLLTPSKPVDRRFTVCVCAMAASMALPLVAASAGGLPLLAPALLLAGMATAPTMVTGMTLVQERVSHSRLNEGMTLAVTALLAGISLGAAAGGAVAERLPGAGPYALPLLAACAAALVSVLAWRLAGTVTARTGERPADVLEHGR